MSRKSFLFLRKNTLSKKLRKLIKSFEIMSKTDEDLTSFLPFIFCKVFMQVHYLLKKNTQNIKDYYSIIKKTEDEISDYIKIGKSFGFKKKSKKSQFSLKTEDYYGMLFENFSNYNYYQEPYDLLTTRLKINNFNLNSFKNKSILDYGCGNGRYTQALAKLALSNGNLKNNILGFDKSKKNIQVAKKRNKYKKVFYKCGDVNKNTIKSNSFDIIFCNGVLHHTGNILAGLKEIRRILKPNGICILYLSSTDGVKWYFIESFREILKKYNTASFFYSLKNLNLSDNKIFYLMDHVFVKHNHLTTTIEVEKLFKSSKLKIVERFKRGHTIDDIERLYQLKSKGKHKLAFDIFGHGEHRYILSKL